MAKVKSLFGFRGSIGDLTFYENEYGPQVKTKGSPTQWHMKNSKSFRNARRNASEWKQATSGAQLLRWAMGSLLKGVNNMRLSGRMNAPMVKALRGDAVHDWGERDIASGDLTALTGFEFNNKLSLDDALPLNVENCYTVEAGKISLQVPAFRLRKKKALPPNATHYRLVSAVVTIDFAKKRFHQDVQASPILPMGRKAGEAFCAEHIIAADTPGCGWLLGIEFYTMKNDQTVLIKGGAMRVMQWMQPSQVEEVVMEEVTEVEQLAGSLQLVEQQAPAVATLLVDTPVPSPVVQVHYVNNGQAPKHLAYQVGQGQWYGTSMTASYTRMS